MFFIKRLPNTQVKNNDVVFEQTDEMDAWMKCNAVKRFIFKGMMTLFLFLDCWSLTLLLQIRVRSFSRGYQTSSASVVRSRINGRLLYLYC